MFIKIKDSIVDLNEVSTLEKFNGRRVNHDRMHSTTQWGNETDVYLIRMNLKKNSNAFSIDFESIEERDQVFSKLESYLLENNLCITL